MKKVIVISTSLRRGSNSDMLADQFIEGAKAAGNDVEKISLVDKNIQFCKGCLGCQKLGRYRPHECHVRTRLCFPGCLSADDSGRG